MPDDALLSSDTVEALFRAPELARGLPNACYHDRDYFEREADQIFTRQWVCVAVASEVPEPGDVKPVSVAGKPLIVLRDRAGDVRVFHNVCSHRGVKLVDAPCKGAPALRCPYHSWAYALDGQLKATPHVGGFGQNRVEGFSRDDKGLKPVRTVVWWDMIFVNISGGAPDFTTVAAPLSERWKRWDMSGLRYGGSEDSSLALPVNTNWKLAVENYCESYHLPWVHPGLNSYSRLEDHYHIFGENFSGQGSTKYDPRLPNGWVLPKFPNLTSEDEALAEYVVFFPNVLLGIQADHFYVMILDVEGSQRTVERLHIYYLKEAWEQPDLPGIRTLTRDRWREVFVEDIDMVERLQEGRISPAFDGGCFSPVMDTPTLHFQRLIAKAAGQAPDSF